MALTITDINRSQAPHGLRQGIIDVTFDNTYPAGGWPVTLAQFKMDAAITAVLSQNTLLGSVSAKRVMLSWDGANSKIIATNITTGLPIVDAADLNGQTARFLVWGY